MVHARFAIGAGLKAGLPPRVAAPHRGGMRLQLQERAKTFGLHTAYGNLGLLLVVHAELEAGFEPWNHFLDSVNVDEVRAMDAPEGIGIEIGLQLLNGAIVRLPFEIRGDHGNQSVVNSRVDHVLRVDDEIPMVALNEDLGALE